jgi:hypothetical protein
VALFPSPVVRFPLLLVAGGRGSLVSLLFPAAASRAADEEDDGAEILPLDCLPLGFEAGCLLDGFRFKVA